MVYHSIRLNLTKHQLEKIAHAIREDTSVKLRIAMDHNGSHSLHVSERQHNKLLKGGNHDIEFSKAHIHHLKIIHPKLKSGGFLPLVALIPLIASALAGVGGLSGGIASAVNSTKAAHEAERHNKEVEKALGSGLYLHPHATNARGLNLSPAGRGHTKCHCNVK